MNGTNESAMTLSSAVSSPVASSAANVRTRYRKPVSLVGDQSSRPSATAHASNEASVAADRPDAIARRLSSTQPSRPCLDHDRRVVIPIEFTVAYDANLSTAVRRKHAKYDLWLQRNPCFSVARLVPGARDPHTWTFDPLVV